MLQRKLGGAQLMKKMTIQQKLFMNLKLKNVKLFEERKLQLKQNEIDLKLKELQLKKMELEMNKSG